MKWFGIVIQNNFDGKTWYPPLIHNLFHTRNFLNTEKFPQEIFRYCETKIFQRKIVLHPIMHKIFRYPKFYETQKGYRTKFFRSCETKNFRQNRYAFQISHAPHPSSVLCMEISDTRIFLTYKRVLLRIFSALWDKKISTENSDIPFLFIKFFDTRNFLKQRSVPQRNFLVLRQKILNEVYCIKYRNLSWIWCL